MKKLLRNIFVGIFLFFCWPIFLYKKYGNGKHALKDKTIIVCNHYSTFDAFFIYLIYRKKSIRFVTIAETKQRYLSKFVTWLFDCLYIGETKYNIGFFKKCIDILNDNGIICIFPEGAINPRKCGFLEFKNSFAFFAKKTGANILPVYIYPELKLFKRSKVYIGELLTEQDYQPYRSLEELSIFVQCKIMDYSCIS